MTDPQQQAMPQLPDARGHALVAYGRVQHLCISAEVAETLLDKYLDRADPGGAHIEFLFSRAQLDAYAAEAVARALAASALKPGCSDPMCACRGGPCAECRKGEEERDRATGQAWREDSSLEKWFPLTADELKKLRRSLDFYRCRVELLQEWQSRMRDPERTIACDIIANGQMLPDVDGSRYGSKLAASAPSREAPEGWKLVPVKPTQEMLKAGELAHWNKERDMNSPTPTEFYDELGGPFGYAWIAMLDTAPSTSGEGGKEGDDHA